MINKTCTKCGEEKPLTDFSTNKGAKDGHRNDCKECRRNYYSKNKPDKEKVKNWNRQWYSVNREAKLLASKERVENNRGSVRASNAKRRAAKLQRTPAWSEELEIKRFYANCPEGYHVDHIEPLQGEDVSGLHVIANLQYLPAAENISKGNRRAA